MISIFRLNYKQLDVSAADFVRGRSNLLCGESGAVMTSVDICYPETGCSACHAAFTPDTGLEELN